MTITASFGVLASLRGTPRVWEIFIFLGGAATAFSLVEVFASKGFRVKDVSEPADVVFLGTALNMSSIALGVGASALVGWQITGWPAWVAGPFCATLVYLLAAGLEMAVAERIEGRD